MVTLILVIIIVKIVNLEVMLVKILNTVYRIYSYSLSAGELRLHEFQYLILPLFKDNCGQIQDGAKLFASVG